MMRPEAIIDTEARYEETTEARETALAAVAEHGPVVAADPERVAKRIEHLTRAVIDTEEARDRLTDVSALERIIGANNLVAARFLTGGVRAARSVARVVVNGARGAPSEWGTGSMVSSRLFLTNEHVFASADIAAASVIEFGYEEIAPGVKQPATVFRLEPDTFFFVDAGLDFALVAVASTGDDGSPLGAYGWNPLIEQDGKVLVGESVNIVQHPDGRPKELSLRENKVVTILEDFLHYESDTDPGSSGAPVFNDQWQLVALHHSGVPRTDDQGRWLTRDGTVWNKAMSMEAVHWKANEGARVSRIIATLKAAPLTGAFADLRDEVVSGAVPSEQVDGTEAGAPAARRRTAGVTPARETVEVAIPVRLRIEVLGGDVVAGAAVAAAPKGAARAQPARPSGISTSDLQAALSELSRATERPYFDEAADAAAAKAYYHGLPKRGRTFQPALVKLMRAAHTTTPSYRPAIELYPWVDLDPGLKLTSIYSGQKFDPARIIADDLERETARVQRQADESTLDEAALEALLPYNCEHVVPQSWFHHDEPMRGDLHHLFTCERRCNSFRGSAPFYEFDPVDEATRVDCGRRDRTQFEPNAGKGAVARATIYVILRYGADVDWSQSQYTADRIAMLLDWHRRDPVTTYERHRNAAIAARQGNRSPLVDHPEWVDALDLSV